MTGRKPRPKVWTLTQDAAEIHVFLEGITSGGCPIPQCGQPPTSLVSFQDPSREVSVDSCLLLCAVHGHLALEGSIDVDFLRTVRKLLRLNRVAVGASGSARIIGSREEYLKTIRDAMNAGSSSLRMVYVGPFPLHPEWYFALNDGATGMPNMDRSARNLAFKLGADAKIIFRNNARYLHKVHEILPANLVASLKDDLHDSVNRIRSLGQHAPRFRCMETGTLHIPTILDSIVIAAARTSPQQPIDGGLEITDTAQIAWEAAAFDRLFESSLRSRRDELDALDAFVEEI